MALCCSHLAWSFNNNLTSTIYMNRCWPLTYIYIYLTRVFFILASAFISIHNFSGLWIYDIFVCVLSEGACAVLQFGAVSF